MPLYRHLRTRPAELQDHVVPARLSESRYGQWLSQLVSTQAPISHILIPVYRYLVSTRHVPDRRHSTPDNVFFEEMSGALHILTATTASPSPRPPTALVLSGSCPFVTWPSSCELQGTNLQPGIVLRRTQLRPLTIGRPRGTRVRHRLR